MNAIKSNHVIVFAFFLADMCLAGEGGERAWWPQSYSVQRDARVLRLSTRYYTAEHDLTKGGAISRISLLNGRATNLLISPVGTSVQLSGAALTLSDLDDPAASLSHGGTEERPVVTASAILQDKNHTKSNISTITTYTYGWGYIKIRKEIRFAQPAFVRDLCVVDMALDPSLSDYAYRPNAHEPLDPDPLEWEASQVRHTGKLRAGSHLDMPVQMRHLPKHVLLTNPGIEGLEWFMADDVGQWDYQLTGVPGTGWFIARAVPDPPRAIAVAIHPLLLSRAYELPKGGATTLQGSYVFDYYLAFPVLEDHAQRPWLNASYNVNRGQWVSSEQIARNASNGIVTMHLHNDADYYKDGIFWRDGSYPPYPPEQMKKMDEVIAVMHHNGIHTVPYFSNHELNQSTEAFKTHGAEWGRVMDDQNNLRPNFRYGAHMCLKSGWLSYFEASVDRVLTNHAFDGVYYD